MTTNNELHEGDTVRIVKGMLEGLAGPVHAIGYHKIYLVEIAGRGTYAYFQNEIERVTPEEIGTLKYGYEEWVRGLPPMPAPPDEIERVTEESRGVV